MRLQARAVVEFSRRLGADSPSLDRLLEPSAGTAHGEQVSTTLGDRMDEVFRGIVTHIEELRPEDAAEVRRQQAHRIAVELYEQLRQRLESERKQTRELWRQAVRFRRSIELRQFISAFEARARAAGEPTAEQQRWIDWARAKADWLDPLIEVSDLILDAPKPRAPGYW